MRPVQISRTAFSLTPYIGASAEAVEQLALALNIMRTCSTESLARGFEDAFEELGMMIALVQSLRLLQFCCFIESK